MNSVIESDNLIIRRTEQTDIGFVTEAENHPENSMFVSQWTEKEHLQALQDEAVLHLTIETKLNKKRVGYLIIAGINNPNKNIELKRIVIVDKGLGYGKETIQLIKNLIFKQYNAHRLWLDVKLNNIRARTLYQAAGFKEEGILRECLFNQANQEYESLAIMSILRSEYFQVEAVIFDMDGVIIDSEPIYYQVNLEIFNQLGINLTETEYQKYVGITDTDMWNQLKATYQLPQTIQQLLEFQVRQNRELLSTYPFEPISGVVQLLNRLKHNRIKIGLASSSPLHLIETVLEKCNIRNYFDVIVSSEQVANGKPAPDIYLLAAKQLAVNPGRCWAIEDSTNGVKAAKAAGMSCIGYVNPNSYNQDLKLADQVVEHFDQIIF
ncbi:MAG TPA: HAD-IA family hydrolase [Bacillota bacterium]|nr:HAD-IA family hydrolase [Bacillota bacterium]HOL09120.1 HAD-IA family hydrolase [Bacillota bacterium]HPO97177.1 HAD-IA family hydrolase [Bacillota bacterium]